MLRHELTDDQYQVIEPLLPDNGERGGQWEDHHKVLNGVFWRLRTGCPWRDIPERYGPWSTVYDRFRRWTRDGTLDRIVEALQVRLDEGGQIDWELFCIDGSSIRASRAAAGAGKRGAPRNRTTMHWAARAAGTAPRSTWSRTVGACR